MPDWEKILTDYTTGDLSQRKLAEKWGVSVSTLQKRATKEGWSKRRMQYRRKVVSKTEEKRAGRKADKLVKLQDISEGLADVMVQVLADSDQFNRWLVEFGSKEKIHKKVDMDALRKFTASLKDLESVTRSVFSLPGKADDENMRIARARLKLDQERAAGGGDKDDGPGVVFLGERLKEPQGGNENDLDTPAETGSVSG